MRRRRIFLGLLFAALLMSVSAFAAGRANVEPNALLNKVISKLDHEVPMDADGPAMFAALIEKEYGTRKDELKLGLEQKLGWGDITALAYIQATTGKSFADMIKEDARSNFWAYADNAGMNCGKMTQLLDDFLKRAERERNTRIFGRLRTSRRVLPLPDLGNGFGLFQESLDFRHIDVPQPTKIHDVPGDLLAGGQ